MLSAGGSNSYGRKYTRFPGGPNHSAAEYTLARLYVSTGRRVAGQALIYRFERQRQTEKEKESQKPGIELAQN